MLSLALLALGAAYLQTAPFAARSPAQAPVAQVPVYMGGPASVREMQFQRADGIYVQSTATGAQGRSFFNDGVVGAAGFAVGAALAVATSRRADSARRSSTVQMRGWDDPFAGNAFREGGGGGNRASRPGRGNSSFEQEMQEAEDSYNQKLAIFSAAITVPFLCFRAVAGPRQTNRQTSAKMQKFAFS